ncbi:MAG: prolyl oligopeptidase family serine peptidase [Patescibacteria group bacterium]|nr:prolyl oligopeptidase family serine peptidase [Patescibacteria group bacterium]
MQTIVLLLAATWVAATPSAGPATFEVTDTFDGRPFEYRMELAAQRPEYRVYRLHYPSPVETPFEANNTVPGEYYLPEGIGPNDPKRPAVICLHILGGGFELVQLVTSSLAARGIPAAWMKLPYYGERRPAGLKEDPRQNPRHFAEALSQGLLDVRRMIDLLAARPEIDRDRIGVTGISLGGMLAGTVAGADSRIHRAALILSGGDALEIIYHARESRRICELLRGLPLEDRRNVEQTLRSVDPLTYASELRGRAQDGRVLMINAGSDEVIPRASTDKLAKALGIEDEVIWLDGLGHYTAMAALPQALQTTVAFFAKDLPEGVQPAQPAARAAGLTPLRRVVRLVQQAGAFVGTGAEPAAGKCHFLDWKASVVLADGKKVEGSARIVRGEPYRFRAELDIPKVATGVFAQGRGPWLGTGGNTAFYGELPVDRPAEHPFHLAAESNILKLRAATGILTALDFAPESLERWVSASDEKHADGRPAIRLARKDRPGDYGLLVFHEDGVTPAEAEFDVEGVQGRVVFRAWQINTIAHDTLFEPSEGTIIQKVDAADLYRMFAALLNFAAETIR